MRKILFLILPVVLLLQSCGDNTVKDNQPGKKLVDDTLSYDAVIKNVQVSKLAMDASTKILQDKISIATSEDSVAGVADKAELDKKKKWVTEKSERDNAFKDFANKEKASNDAYALLSKLYAEKAKCHPVENAESIGKRIIIWIFVLTLLILIAVIVFVRWGKFNLREALSENAIDKTTIKNPEYSVDKMKEWLVSLNTSNSTQLQDALTQAKQNLQATVATLTAAESSLWTAHEIASPGEPTRDEQTAINSAQKIKDDAQKARDDAQAKTDKAQSDADTGKGNTISPAVLAIMGNLFPPTIEVTGVDYQAIADMKKITDKIKNAGGQGDQEDIQQLKTLADKIANTYTNTSRPSASRLIALISGLMLIIVAIAMVCFYIYYYLSVGCAPDLTSLSTVLIALGFGMAPYAVNKITAAAGSTK